LVIVSAMATRRIGRSPGFVDEDKAFRIQFRLIVEPVLSPLQDVRAILFAGRVP
jgi:hypothetical protein